MIRASKSGEPGLMRELPASKQHLTEARGRRPKHMSKDVWYDYSMCIHIYIYTYIVQYYVYTYRYMNSLQNPHELFLFELNDH